MLRVTDSSRAPLMSSKASRLAGCAGFRVDDAHGRVGTVTGVGIDPSSGAPAWLMVRTGLFVRRQVAISAEAVRSVDPVARTIVTTGDRVGGVRR